MRQALRSRFRLPPLRIGTFLSILHLVVGVLGAGIISAFSLYFIYQSGYQSILREVEDLAFVTENALEGVMLTYYSGIRNEAEVEAVLRRYLKSRPDLHFTILSPEGRAFLPDPGGCLVSTVTLDSPEVQGALARGVGHALRDCPDGERNVFVATTIIHEGQQNGILVLAAPFHEVMAPTYRTMAWMGVIALLIVAFTVFEGWLGSSYISRPLARLSLVAERLSAGDLTARAAPEGPLEVAHLAGTLNEMAARVQNSMDTMRAFVGNASHELRTPLTTIKLQVGALAGGAHDDPEVSERFFGQIESEIDRLTYLVNDMLDLSQVEGGAPPVRVPVNLVDLAGEVRAFWEARARQAGLGLGLQAEGELPCVLGDPYRLRQLFDNLLDNAIKFTAPGGQVEICLRPSPDQPDGMVRFEVRDTGRGIPTEHLPFIFDRFYRLEMQRQEPRALPERPQGSGLGLALARSIAHAHGGEIGVRSQVGAGSTFWVELPAGCV